MTKEQFLLEKSSISAHLDFINANKEYIKDAFKHYAKLRHKLSCLMEQGYS